MIVIFTLQAYLASLGVVDSDKMAAAISKWYALYKNSGSMSLASTVASEVARLVTLDIKSEVTGSKRAEIINDAYGDVLGNIRRVCEFACAKGGIVLKPYVKNGKIFVSYIQAENFVPCEFDESGKISGAVFLDRYHDGKKVYTRIEKHSLRCGIYKIENSVFMSYGGSDLGRRVNLSAVPQWKHIQPRVTMRGIDKPLFAYLTMPMANNIDPASPLGVSVYAKAEDLIRDAQKQYERLLWEFESGERALYIDETAIRKNTEGRYQLPEKRLYRMINSGNELFEDWSPELREKSIIRGLNEILRKIEFATGLAYGTLSDVRDVERTAEEFRASRQRSYAQVLDIQTSLKKALLDLVSAMEALVDLYLLEESGRVNVSFEFDDSIAADRQVEFEEKIRLLDKGIIRPWEVRAWYLGEDEAQAREGIDKEKLSHMSQ